MNLLILALILQFQVASGTLATSADCATPADSCVKLQLDSNVKSAVVQVTGQFAGDVRFEGSIDNSTYNWIPVTGKRLGAASPVSSKLINGTTGTGVFVVDVAGLLAIRVRADSLTFGLPQIIVRQATN